jgi:dTDP-glucose pyrophosphorylase
VKIIVPMAGRGARLSALSGLPKPLISVAGRPMISWALNSVKHIPHTQIVFIALTEHEECFGIKKVLEHILGHSPTIVLIDQVTDGQLCTVLAAHDFLDSDEDVLITSSDTFVLSDLENDIAHRSRDCCGIISVADMLGDRWSFARVDEKGQVLEVAEKVRISKHVSTGLYYFSNSQQLVEIAEEMIQNKEMIHGEYYVIPVYQKYIERGWQVTISVAQEMWDMGTPEALKKFEEHIMLEKS